MVRHHRMQRRPGQQMLDDVELPVRGETQKFSVLSRCQESLRQCEQRLDVARAASPARERGALKSDIDLAQASTIRLNLESAKISRDSMLF